jgi:hypothetical protein
MHSRADLLCIQHTTAHTQTFTIPAGAVLLAISEWCPSPPRPPSSDAHSTASSIPPDMLCSCHEILAANAKGVGGDLILRVCGMSSALGQTSDDSLLAAAAFAACHSANTASHALVMRTRCVMFRWIETRSQPEFRHQTAGGTARGWCCTP